MNDITEKLLEIVSDWDGKFKGAYNIRENSGCAGRQSSENIRIESKTDNPGINIFISSKAQQETVYIPACVTHGGVEDLVYNDFFVEEGADVIIVAGCGVHSDDEEEARHNGIHRFFVGKNAKVLYKEKHIGTGKGAGAKRIDPVTDATLDENAYMEMDTSQLGGVTSTSRTTNAKLGAGAKLVIRERLLTDGDERAKSVFNVSLDGDGSAADLVSRSVARGNSYQEYISVIEGNCRCTGHSECDAILAENGRVNASPALNAACIDASLIHEAAIGKIAGEQIIKLEVDMNRASVHPCTHTSRRCCCKYLGAPLKTVAVELDLYRCVKGHRHRVLFSAEKQIYACPAAQLELPALGIEPSRQLAHGGIGVQYLRMRAFGIVRNWCGIADRDAAAFQLRKAYRVTGYEFGRRHIFGGICVASDRIGAGVEAEYRCGVCIVELDYPALAEAVVRRLCAYRVE